MAADELIARPVRFLDADFKPVSSSVNLDELIANSLENFDQLFEEEQKNAPKYSKAWTKASKMYESVFKDLGSKDKKFITEELSEKLPEGLKSEPTRLVIAVIAYTMDHQDFTDRFNETTRGILSENKKWEGFRFKSFFVLLTYAIKLLPSRPNPQMEKLIFRGLNSEVIPQVDDVFSLSQFSSFSPRRRLALGLQPKYKKAENEGDEEADEEDEDEVAPEAENPNPPKMLLRIKFGAKVEALGVRHLSPFGVKEVEVLVSPLQKFKVKKVNERERFSVVVVQPVD